MEKVDLNLKLNKMDLWTFMLRTQFLGFKGLFVLIINIIIIIVLAPPFSEGDVTKILLLLLVLFLYDIANPFILYKRAKAQADSALPMTYTLSEEGILAASGDESIEFRWGHIFKARIGAKKILVYTSALSAFIFPKNQISDEDYLFIKNLIKNKKSEFRTLSLATVVHTGGEEEVEEDIEELEVIEEIEESEEF